ncbi:MAG: hypothetical protein QNJ97_25235 [Myxococcota bacterium]|nr:hypothetical protein [Myxococcota bacterium]
MSRPHQQNRGVDRPTDLFAIDVDAEIKKLVSRRFKTDGEAAIDLVVFVSRHNPTKIDITHRRRYLAIESDCQPLENTLFDHLATVFDPHAQPDARHRALVALEKAGGLALLAAFASRPSRVTFEWTADGVLRGLAFTKGRTPKGYRPTHRLARFGIAITGWRSHYRKEADLIAHRCRFSPDPLRRNGKRISQTPRLDNCLVKERLEREGFIGEVGVPVKGDLIAITELNSGIVTREVVLSSTSGMALDVIVEDKKQASRDIAEVLVQQGRRLYASLASLHATLDPPLRKRATSLLFEYCTRTGDEHLIAGVRAFDQIGGPPLTLSEVKTGKSTDNLYAIDSDAAPEDYDTGDRRVLRLDQAQRRFLRSVLKEDLPTPPPRIRSKGLYLRPIAQMRRVLSSLSVYYPLSGAPVPDDALTPKELAFLTAVRRASASDDWRPAYGNRLTPLSIFMVNRRWGPPKKISQRAGRTAITIARYHPLTVKMIQAFSNHAAFLAPALYLIRKK